MGLHLNQNSCHFLRIEMRLCYKLRAQFTVFVTKQKRLIQLKLFPSSAWAPAGASILPHLMLCLFIVNHPVKYIFDSTLRRESSLILSMLSPSNLGARRPSKAQLKNSRAGNKIFQSAISAPMQPSAFTLSRCSPRRR
jgi:hypothetical protein